MSREWTERHIRELIEDELRNVKPPTGTVSWAGNANTLVTFGQGIQHVADNVCCISYVKNVGTYTYNNLNYTIMQWISGPINHPENDFYLENERLFASMITNGLTQYPFNDGTLYATLYDNRAADDYKLINDDGRGIYAFKPGENGNPDKKFQLYSKQYRYDLTPINSFKDRNGLITTISTNLCIEFLFPLTRIVNEGYSPWSEYVYSDRRIIRFDVKTKPTV